MNHSLKVRFVSCATHTLKGVHMQTRAFGYCVSSTNFKQKKKKKIPNPLVSVRICFHQFFHLYLPINPNPNHFIFHILIVINLFNRHHHNNGDANWSRKQTTESMHSPRRFRWWILSSYSLGRIAFNRRRRRSGTYVIPMNNRPRIISYV